MISNLKVLLPVLLVLALASYWVVNREEAAQPESADHEWLLPALRDDINGVNRIDLLDGDATVVLLREQGQWRLDDAAGFYADREKVAALLLNLRGARYLEKKTANAENHARLGLDESAVQVRVTWPDKSPVAVLIGNRSSNGLGTFVRHSDQAQTWLVSDLNAIQVNASQWRMNKIIDVGSDLVQAVHVLRDGETALVFSKSDPGQSDFVLENMPDGLQLKTGPGADQLANGLRNFIVDSAVPQAMDDLQPVVQLRYDLYSGASHLLDVYRDAEGTHFVTLATAGSAQLASQGGATDSASTAPVDRDYTGWMFAIPEYKFNALNKTIADFTEPAQTPEITPDTDEETAEDAVDNAAS